MSTKTSNALRLGGALTCATALALPLALVQLPTASAATATAEHGAVATSTDSVATSGVDRAALGELRADEGAAVSPAVLTDRVETPEQFDVVGVTWSSQAAVGAVSVQVRILEDGSWSSWEVLPVEDGGPDPGSPEAVAAGDVVGTTPLATAGADGYQVRLDTATGRVPGDVEVRLVDGGEGDVAAADAAMGARAAAESATARGSAVAVSSTSLRPTIVTRKAWGADESMARGTSSRNTKIKAMVVHHTASSNNYSTASQAESQLRGIYAYHTKSLGWADIGYNFLVDKFGTIYEGRRGSITENVVGAHASGFNTDTMGVSAIGNYQEAAPSSAMVKSIASVVAWKLGENGVSPTGKTTLTSAGGSTSRFSAGRTVELPTVTGHRQTSYTTCPGDNLFSKLPSITSQAAQMITAATTPATPAVPVPVPASAAAGAQTLVGDWDGDGRDQVGLFVDGAVSLRRADGSVLRYRYGSAGDVAVVGDWDGDGRETVGVFRRGQWLLKDSLGGGGADRAFWMGQAGDVPVVGRWNGRDLGVGVYRNGRWMLTKYVGAGPVHISLDLGRPTDRPLVGDWDGNGSDTPGLQRGQYRFSRSSWGPGAPVPVAVFGRPTTVGFAADTDGDGRDGWGVRLGSSFLFRPDTRGGAATTSLTFTG